jgi:AcrR family transcriptional regulator
LVITDKIIPTGRYFEKGGINHQMQQRSETTRAQLLQAAQKLFAKNGYDATGVAEICSLAGVSKGAFYHHFPTKQVLFLELLKSWLSGLDAQMNAVVEGPHNVPQALIDMAGMMQNVFRVANEQLPMFLEFWTQSSRDPVVWQATIAPYRRYQTFFTALVQNGVDEGSLKAVDPEAAARLILAMAVGLLFQSLLDPQGANWENMTKQSMQLLMNGLAKEQL